MPALQIGNRLAGDGAPAYFIADISANHDGSLERAKTLIHLAAECRADAAKFQNFRAPKIVSERGFASMGGQVSHQATWNKPVYQVYVEASLPWEWTAELRAECERAGIHYFSTPYDLDAVDMLDPYVVAFKIGSGDITWTEMLRKVASKNKPVILATGAANIGEVQSAVEEVLAVNGALGLMQCNTNYTGSLENFKHVHLNVLRTYQTIFPEAVLGLSDHTPGHAAVLGAVALGARLIEKHFTDDIRREGPDHRFSMTPEAWREMVDRTRELEYALGSGAKRVCENERDTVVVQRRCLRASRDLPAGAVLTRDMVEVLRPAPARSIIPSQLVRVLGQRLRRAVPAGEAFSWGVLESPE